MNDSYWFLETTRARRFLLALAWVFVLPCFAVAAKDSIEPDENAQITWGATTNGLRAGLFGVTNALHISLDSQSRGTTRPLFRVLASVVSSNVACYLPRAEQDLILELTSVDATPVPMTQLGLTVRSNAVALLNSPYRRSRFGRTLIHPTNNLVFGKEIVLTDHFVITNVGTYGLSMRLVVAVQATNAIPQTIALPEVKIPVRVGD